MLSDLGAYLCVRCWKTKGTVRRICPLGGSLLSELHPRPHAMWKRALGACLFAYAAGVRALARRDGAWVVLVLKRIKLSVEQGTNPHCGHIHTPIDRVAKTNQRGEKNDSGTNSVFLPFWSQGSSNLCGEKVPPLCICKKEQPRLNRGDCLYNKLQYVDCEILSIRLCDSVAHTHYRFHLH